MRLLTCVHSNQSVLPSATVKELSVKEILAVPESLRSCNAHVQTDLVKLMHVRAAKCSH